MSLMYRFTKRLLLSLFSALLVLMTLEAQVAQGRFGHEWIKYDQSYVKIAVAQDGFYRLSQAELAAAGVPSGISGEQLQLFWLGKEQRISVSNNGTWAAADYLEFYGEQNRSQLDRNLWEDPDKQMLNPDYSLYSDTSYYFLTWKTGANHLRFPITDTDVGTTLPARTSYRHTEKINLHDRALKPTIDAQGVTFSLYLEAEGFASAQTTSFNQQIAAKSIAPNASPATARIRMSGNSQDHNVEVSLNSRLIANPVFAGISLVDTTIELSLTDLSENNTINFKTSGTRDRIVVSTIDLSYDHLMSFAGESAAVLSFADASEGVYFEMADFAHGGVPPIVIDMTMATRITPILENGIVKVLLAPGSADREIRVIAAADVSSIIAANPISFASLENSDAQYIIISNEQLFSGSDGENWVQNYADYRSSSIGGNFKTQIITAADLADQFAFGATGHPLSIKNFANYIAANWENPQYIFLIGRGYHYDIVRTESRANNFLPTYGIPASDNLLVGAGDVPIPLIPIGRLGASSSDDIRIYLDKVMTLEDLQQNAPQEIDERGWMKQVLHLSAGGAQNVNERLILEQSLASMAKQITGEKFGAEVRSFSKNTQDLVTPEISEDLTDYIEDGVVLRTYFGHGGITITELDYFEHPENFNNENRYPCMVSLGCHTGDMYTDATSLSEENVLAEKRGGIAYIATSGLGFLSALSQFGSVWYDLLSTDLFGAPLGNSLQATLQTVGNITSVGMRTLAQQLTLHGDPAYRLSRPDTAPDLTFVASSARTEPSSISSTVEEFEFFVDMVNLGAVNLDSVPVTFRHILPNGQIASSTTLNVAVDSYRKSLSAVLPNTTQGSSGKNVIQVVVNETQEKVEGPAPAAYNNNTLDEGFVFFIRDNAVQPVIPCNFAIVNRDSEKKLKAATSNPFSARRTYVFELDTTNKFDSPFLQRIVTERSGGLVEWTPPITYSENQVYFWRVSPDSTEDQTYIWQESSFTYLQDGSEGWSQGHYEQLLQDEVRGFVIEGQRNIRFDSSGFYLTLNNGIFGGDVGIQYNYSTFSASTRPWAIMPEGIAVMVVDPVTGAFWTNSGGQFGSINSSSFATFRAFAFPTSTPEERALLVNMLENEIPDGHNVYVYSVLRNAASEFHPQTWETDPSNSNIFDALEKQGATKIRMLKELGSVPYTMIYEKGAGVLGEDIALNKEDLIITEIFNRFVGTNGSITSTIIGPAKEWGSLLWNLQNIEPSDSNVLKVSALNPDKTVGIERTFQSPETLELDFVDAEIYPFIQLDFSSSDELEHTSSVLDLWRVEFEGFPDLVLNPNEVDATDSDTLDQGNQLVLNYQIENISSHQIDSVLIRYILTDSKNESTITDIRVAPTEANGSQALEFRLDTDNLNGKYRLSIELNPEQELNEKSYLNNIGIFEFFVRGDSYPPLLEVTFDGVYIREGEIVSPRPLINISLRDENTALLLDDPTLFEITLVHPDGSEEKLNIENDERIKFTPSELDNSTARIEFDPNFLVDGYYRLQVQGSDHSGNKSGPGGYDIGFQVISEQAVSEVFNYPNPFSTSTQFVFTMTGEELPERISIQIMTTAGQIVRTISTAELGPLKRGVNQTDFQWDGTDQFGDRLANGIYLYRVRIEDNAGDAVKKLDVGRDFSSFFKRDLGKLVILR